MKVNSYGQRFLEEMGRGLGYSEDDMPEVKDIEIVRTYHIPVWEYNGMTKEEYYGSGELLG
jgi:hypothetical protein